MLSILIARAAIVRLPGTHVDRDALLTEFTLFCTRKRSIRAYVSKRVTLVSVVLFFALLSCEFF